MDRQIALCQQVWKPVLHLLILRSLNARIKHHLHVHRLSGNHRHVLGYALHWKRTRPWRHLKVIGSRHQAQHEPPVLVCRYLCDHLSSSRLDHNQTMRHWFGGTWVFRSLHRAGGASHYQPAHTPMRGGRAHILRGCGPLALRRSPCSTGSASGDTHHEPRQEDQDQR